MRGGARDPAMQRLLSARPNVLYCKRLPLRRAYERSNSCPTLFEEGRRKERKGYYAVYIYKFFTYFKFHNILILKLIRYFVDENEISLDTNDLILRIV